MINNVPAEQNVGLAGWVNLIRVIKLLDSAAIMNLNMR